MRKLFEENGFKTTRLQTTGISLTRIKTSKGKSNQAYVSETSDDELLRFKIEKSAFLKLGKKVLNSALNLCRVGDSLKGSFEK